MRGDIRQLFFYPFIRMAEPRLVPFVRFGRQCTEEIFPVLAVQPVLPFFLFLFFFSSSSFFSFHH